MARTTRTHVGLAAMSILLGLAPGGVLAGPIVVGLGGGAAPLVEVYDSATNSLVRSFLAYAPAFAGGVRVASGDVNGDGVLDIVTGAGPGGGPHVEAFDGATGAVLQSFYAFDPLFTGGVFVATGDVNGDGAADIIVAADAHGLPSVNAFDGVTGTLLRSFLAYDARFTGGVRVAAGDVNGDGVADIVTGAGPGGGPHVEAFDGTTGKLIQSFYAFDPLFTGGVFVAVGDTSSSGRGDIVVGADAGTSPQVKVFDVATGSLLRSFFAFNPIFAGGVRVAAADVNRDGVADIITGAGPGGDAVVAVFDGRTGLSIGSFLVNGPTFNGGLYLAASLSPKQSLLNLIAALREDFALGRNLLENSLRSLDDGNTVAACHMLSAFTHQVKAQSGKKMPPSEANRFLAWATGIRFALTCR